MENSALENMTVGDDDDDEEQPVITETIITVDTTAAAASGAKLSLTATTDHEDITGDMVLGALVDPEYGGYAVEKNIEGNEVTFTVPASVSFEGVTVNVTYGVAIDNADYTVTGSGNTWTVAAASAGE